MNHLFISIIYFISFIRLTFGAYRMDNVNARRKYASGLMSAVLIFGSVAAGLLVAPQTAYAAVTITTSSTDFYGPGFVRVLVADTSLDSTDDQITPTIDARDGSTVIGSASPTIESIGGSGTFEFFITTSDFPLMPASPTKTSDQGLDDAWGNGPFIIRANAGQAAGLTVDAGPGTDANGGAVAFDSNSYGLTADMDLVDNFRVLYGGQTAIIDFGDQFSELTADRSEAGDLNEIVLILEDWDANTDPTLVDRFVFVDPLDHITSINFIDYTDAEWQETGQNTGLFELIITVDDTNSLSDPGGDNDLEADLPTGESFTALDHSVYEDLSADGASAGFDAVTAEINESSVSVTLRNRDGSVQLLEEPTLANGFKAQVNDADANITMDDGDATNNIEIWVDFNGDNVQDLGEVDDFFFFETDDGSGQFLPDFAGDRITIEVVADGDELVDGDNGVISLRVADIADGIDIRFTYTDPSFQANDEFTLITNLSTTPGTISADLATAGINDIITLRVGDGDLNTDRDTIETYDASGGEFTINGEVVATLDILAIDEDVGLPSPGFEATFIETGKDTGVFVADDVDMGEINDSAEVGGDLDDGDEVEFTYTDLMEDPEEDDDVTVTIGLPDAGIDTSRSTIPVPTPGEPVTITLTVFDSNANENPGSVEEILVPLATIEVRDGDGAEFNGDDDPADVEDLTGLVGDITLRETGPNTGIFDEDVDLEPDIADIDRLRDTRVTFEYDGETTSVTYRSFDGIVSATPSVVSPGNETIVRVIDQDGNKDPDEREEVEVAFETNEDTDEGTACIGGAGACLVLEETGPNTGIFEEIVEIGVDIEVADVAAEDFSSEIDLTYVDAITSSGDEDEDREFTIRVATGTGVLSRDTEKVGPGTEIILTLGDLDINENPNGRDDIDPADDEESLEINSSEGDDGFIGVEETGPNTGVFEGTIQFEPRDPDEDGELDGAGDEWTYTVLPGDIIAIQYTDETDALGRQVLVSMVFEIISEDGQLEAADATVQAGETIELTVMDADANRDGDALDTVDIDITSSDDPIGFTLAALETGDNTGVFTATIPTSLTVSSGSINVRQGGSVFLEYTDEFPADYEDRVDTVLDPSRDFTLVVPVGTPIGNINSTTPKAPVLTDISGNTLSEVTVGQQVVLNVDIKNNNATPQSFAAVVEVKDSDGFTVYLQWQTGTLNPSDTVNVGLSYTPSAAGDYTARSYVLSSILNPTVLSTVATSTFTVS